MALILAASTEFESARTAMLPLMCENHRVVTVPSVQKAMEWLQEAKAMPDLIIADVGLRVFGGKEFIQKLKATDRWKSIPVLVQTRSSMLEIFEFCEGTLNKPYSARELINAVNLMLGLPSYHISSPR